MKYFLLYKHNYNKMEHINDKFKINECNALTRIMLEAGMDINRVCLIINEYQTKYIFIKENDFKLSQQFTFEKWWKTRH